MLLYPCEDNEEAKLLASESDTHEYLPVAIPLLALSKSSYIVGNIRSILGLPLLTNDMSESGSFEDSYVLPALVNGDLHDHMYHKW